MTKILSSREVIKLLRDDGWELVRTEGDHHHFRHETKPGRVTVPHPRKSIKVGLLRSIYRQAGWDWKKRR